MSKELDDAYFRSTPCTHHEPLLSKLVDCVNLLEERIKGLLGATVSVGETKTLPAGSEATASAAKRGYDTVLDFGIPRGEKGDKGEPGEPGKDGAPGSDANVTKENVENALGYEPLKGLTVAGTEIIPAGGIVDLPNASNKNRGVVGINTAYGIGYNASLPALIVVAPINDNIDKRNTAWNRNYLALTLNEIDYAVKAAMCDGKGTAWTSNERKAAQKRLGIDTTAPNSRIWFSHQEPGTDIETNGYFLFKLAALESSDMLDPIEYVKELDMIFWNGYAYFVQDNDGTSAGGDTRFEFAPHKA